MGRRIMSLSTYNRYSHLKNIGSPANTNEGRLNYTHKSFAKTNLLRTETL